MDTSLETAVWARASEHYGSELERILDSAISSYKRAPGLQSPSRLYAKDIGTQGIEALFGALLRGRGIKLRARAGQGKTLISERLAGVRDAAAQRDCLRFETIHGVKGETHDVTVVVSSQRPGVHQSHWKDWLRDRTSEAARFAYVASSRPKHVLIWAVKKLKAEDRLVLEGLGFELS